MAVVPKKVASRLSSGLKRFQPIISSARARDINESDTVLIVSDLLSELFGYNKYSEITSEHAIRGTYCDLALNIDGKMRFLIEVKAAGLDLKESHVKQAIDYAANQGLEWVGLTNGIAWKVYRVHFTKPINKELVMDLDLLGLNPRIPREIEELYPLTREGMSKAALLDYYSQVQATDKFLLGALMLGEPVLNLIRRELRRISPGIKIQIDEIKKVLTEEVLKREIVDGEKADEANKKVRHFLSKASKPKLTKPSSSAKSQDPIVIGTTPETEQSQLKETGGFYGDQVFEKKKE